MKVLAVDDDDATLMAVSSMVQRLGNDCLVARKGAEAWDILQAERPDVVIADRMMPDMDGLELCRRIRAETAPHQYVYLLVASSLDREEQLREGMLAGADDYLAKPVRLGQLERKFIAARRVTSLHMRLRALNDALTTSETRLAATNSELEHRVRERTAELEASTRELSAFAYSLSHDLRGPLRSLHGFSQILMDDYGQNLDETGLDHVRKLQRNASQMSDTINDLLRLSRTTRADLTRSEIDLSRLAESVVDDLRSQNLVRGVQISVEDGLVASGDASLIRLALQNLLANAVKFTASREAAKISVGSTQQEGERVFVIRDNGVGFDPRFADKLFEPFQRLHSVGDFEGNGIGLAIVHRVIMRHGGRIWADSTPGQGATFYFTTAQGHDAN